MNSRSQLEVRTRRKLEELKESGLGRELSPPRGIDLSSNDYLGLSDHPRVVQRFAAAVERYGCGSTASRLLRGEGEAFANLERRFAEFKGTEASLFFGSGWAANLGLLTTFLGEGDVVFSDELNHASLIDGMRLSKARRVIFPHGDVGALTKLLKSEPCEGQRFVVTESLFSMDGDRAPLVEYAGLCRQHGVLLVVDEAHAVGVFGTHGSGLIEEMNVEDDVFVSVNTAGKALGVCGAFVAGPRWAIDAMIQSARSFVFSTAPPPSVAAAIDEALSILGDEPERRRKLRGLAKHLRDRLRSLGLDVADDDSPIIPIILRENDRAVAAAKRLQQQGFDVRAIRPPTVAEGTARLRVSVNTRLDESMLDRFVECLIAAMESG